jgi:S1-C subfamily serine protease
MVIVAFALMLYTKRDIVYENFLIGGSGGLGYGTGFFVNENYIVTNWHVVDNCKQIKVIAPRDKKSVVEIINSDKNLDLAILRYPTNEQNFAYLQKDDVLQDNEQNFAYLQKDDVLQDNDDTFIIGYPLTKYGFSDGYVINAKIDYDNVNRTFITNNVQHGNSGGPLLDNQATVAGVISAYLQLQEEKKIDEQTTTDKVGSVIHLSHLKQYLHKNQIQYYESQNSNSALPAEEIENISKEFTVKVRCISQHKSEL